MVRPSPNVPASIESRIVFLAAGGAEADRRWRDRLRSDRLDWGRVADVAIAEGAAGELLRFADDNRWLAIPPDAQGRLQPIAMVTDFRQRVLGQRLFEALAILDDAGVEAVLLKGSALVASVYGAFERRPMSDIDLLVAPEHAERAREALLAAGWVWDRDVYAARHYANHHHLPPLLDRSGSGVAIELHTDVLPVGHPFDFTAAAVRHRSRVVAFEGRHVRVPSPDDQLLHALVHFAWSHAMAPGAWRTVRDVAALCAARPADWDSFVSLARRSRSAASCYWALRLARDVGGVPVPPSVLRQLAPALRPLVLDRLARHFTQIALRNGSACPSVTLRRALWVLAFQPRRNGHGASRPWLGGFAFDAAPSATPSLGARLRARAGRWRQWTRYLAAMLGRSPDAQLALPSPHE